MTDIVLDLRGLKCPLPVLRAARALAELGAGDILVVEATDPMAAIDIPHMVQEKRAVLHEATREASVLIFRIGRAAG